MITGRQVVHQQGDYWKDDFGDWHIWPPKCVTGSIRITGNPAGHSNPNWSVTEHADGTITVSPSINAVGVWHGYLENGNWREC